MRPTATTLFDIDATADRLLVQNPPNAGTLGDGTPPGVNVGDRTWGTLAVRAGR